jgi:hypothetical protein
MNEKNGEAQTKRFSMNMKLAKQKILRKKIGVSIMVILM